MRLTRTLRVAAAPSLLSSLLSLPAWLSLLLALALAACSEEVTPRPGDDAAAAEAGDASLTDQGPGLDGPGDSVTPGDSVNPGDATKPKPDATQPAPDATKPKPDAKPTPTSSEFLLFDKKGLQFTAADKGFHALVNPGDPLPVKNWSTPKDYYAGEFRVRYVITAPANQVAGKLQTCIWTMGTADGDGKNYFPESCADSVSHTGVGTYYGTQLIPSAWWKNGGVPLVFAHPERFLIRAVLRGASGCNVTSYTVSNGCWSEWPNYQNMIFRVTLVMVAKGDTFSGWKNYP